MSGSISLYEVCQEMFNENTKKSLYTETNAPVNDPFETFYKTQRKQFKEMLESLGIVTEAFKIPGQKGLLLPESQKNKVKEFLRSYTSSDMKKIRKRQYDSLDIQKLREYLTMIDEFLDPGLIGQKKYQAVTMASILTRFHLREALEIVRNDSLKIISNELDKLLPLLSGHVFNDTDKIALILLFNQLLKETLGHFSDIVAIVDDMRVVEVTDNIDKPDEEDHQYKPIEELIANAMFQIATESRKRKEPSQQQKARIEAFLNTLEIKSSDGQNR